MRHSLEETALGTVLVQSSADGGGGCWGGQVQQQLVRKLLGGAGRITSIALHPSGDHVITGASTITPLATSLLQLLIAEAAFSRLTLAHQPELKLELVHLFVL